MQIQTHLKLAQVFKRVIQSNADIKLDTSAFLYGNIKPDLTPDYYIDQGSNLKHKIEHYPEKALPHLKAYLDEIMTFHLTPHTKCSKSFSTKLGVLTHYFSDFFCHAHSCRFDDKLIYHYKYELNYANHIAKNLKQYETAYMQKSFPILNNSLDILDLFSTFQTTYLNSSPSVELDSKYVFEFCITMGLSIVHSCTNRSLGTAA